jgi:hypothetical protein
MNGKARGQATPILLPLISTGKTIFEQRISRAVAGRCHGVRGIKALSRPAC